MITTGGIFSGPILHHNYGIYHSWTSNISIYWSLTYARTGLSILCLGFWYRRNSKIVCGDVEHLQSTMEAILLEISG
ncbi:hypothetical protein S83_056095 [Arachis hypogaea]